MVYSNSVVYQKKILVVEDSITQAEMLKHLLQNNNYYVEVSVNGVDALKKLIDFKPMAIISDVMMPKLNGYDLCKIIKEDKLMHKIPVILLTSLSNTEDILFGLECHADYFLEKGCKESLIIDCLIKIEKLAMHDEINEKIVQKINLNLNYKKHFYLIDSEPQKLMDFLITTYEMVIDKNEELIRTENNLKDEISERIRLEVELEDAKNLAESANQSKSTFLANMSHEIRTPLNAILGFSQLMLQDTSITAKQTERLNIVNQSGEHLLSLINNILEISKIEAGSVSVNHKTFDLHIFLKDIENMFKTQTLSKNIRLIFEEDEKILKYIETDEGKLRQMFLNLISNAVKFTNEGGIAVRIKTEKIGDDYYLVSEVEDTGDGIADYEMEKLFSVFQQTETGIKEGGTGLGLALSRQFAILLGGDISAKSVIGQGSCFKLFIQVKVGLKENIVITDKVHHILRIETDGPTKKILIVDDIPENRRYLSEVISPMGFNVQEASDGESAVQKCKNWTPDLVFMDMRMSRLNGFDAASQIKQLDKGNDIKIIMSTATAFNDDLFKHIHSGIEDYVRKPFKINDIYEMIGRILKLNIIYENEISEVVQISEVEVLNTIKKLPTDVLQHMYDATLSAQLDLLIDLINQNKTLKTEAATWLKHAAKNYQYELLLSMFSKYLK